MGAASRGGGGKVAKVKITMRMCPYCNGVEGELLKSEIDGKWRMLCKGCLALGPPAAKKREALHKWNERWVWWGQERAVKEADVEGEWVVEQEGKVVDVT